MTKLQKLTLSLRALLSPRHWMRNYAASQTLDCELARLIDARVPFVSISEYRATIGHLDLWIANHPYASFSTHGVMPSRGMVIRAHAWLMECALSEPQK